MTRFYVPLPAPRVPSNAMLDFSKLNEAADQWNTNRRQNAMLEYQRGRDVKQDARAEAQLGMQREGLNMRREAFNTQKAEAALNRYAGIAQMISEAPPEQQDAMWQRAAPLYQSLRKTIPEFDQDAAAFGIDPNDPAAVGQFIVSRQRGYQDPLKRQEAQAGIANTQAQTQYYLAQAKAKADAAGFKTNVVGGKLVATDAQGNSRVLYDGDISQDPAKLSGISGGLENLAAIPEQFSDATFERSVGPLQGGGVPIASPVARVWGSIWNAAGDRPTTEVRNLIAGSTEALAAAIKPLIRKPGEGVWTDTDQERLVAVVGNLATARDKTEYRRALEGVRDRVRANFNIELPPIGGGSAPGGDDVAKNRKTIGGKSYVKIDGQWFEE